MAEREEERGPTVLPVTKPQKVVLSGQQTSQTLHNFHVEIYASESSAKGSISSHKVKVSTITNQPWGAVGHHGNMIATSNQYLAYVLESKSGYVIRIIQQDTKNRALLKNFVGKIVDIAFAHAHSNLLAAVDEGGNLHVYDLDMAHGDVDKFSTCKKVHVNRSVSFQDQVQHRLAWCPYVAAPEGEDQDESLMIALAHGSTVEVLDLGDVIARFPAQLPIPREKITQGAAVIIDSHQSDVNDLSLSPDGNVLATASNDGLVKFWKLNIDSEMGPVCLHECSPHNGAPVTRIMFCDNLLTQNPNTQFWRFLVTAAKENSEVKLWCTVKWKCLQKISFLHPTEPVSQPRMLLGLDLSASYLFVADTSRTVFYIIPINQEAEIGDASFSSVTEYLLTQPILKFVISGQPLPLRQQDDSEEEDDDDDDDKKEDRAAEAKELDARRDIALIKLHCMQTKSIQEMVVQFDPPDVFGAPPCPDNTPSKTAPCTAAATQIEPRPLDLPPLEDSVPSTTHSHRVLLTPGAFVLGASMASTTPPASMVSKPLLSPQDLVSSVITNSPATISPTTISTLSGTVGNGNSSVPSWDASSLLLGASSDGAVPLTPSTEALHAASAQLPPHPLFYDQQIAHSSASSLSEQPTVDSTVCFTPSMTSTTKADSDMETSTGPQGGGDLVTHPLRLQNYSSSEEGEEFVAIPITTGPPILDVTVEEDAHFPGALDYTSSELSSAYASGREDEPVKLQQGGDVSSPPLLAGPTGGGEPEISVAEIPTAVQVKDKDLDSGNEKEESAQETPRGSDTEEEVTVTAEVVQHSWQVNHDREKETDLLSDPNLTDADSDQQPVVQEELWTQVGTEPTQVELPLDESKQMAENSIPVTDDALANQLPVGKDPMDVKEEEPLEMVEAQDIKSAANMANLSLSVGAGAIVVETSLLVKLLEAVTQQQLELQLLRKEQQEGMLAMRTHMEGVLDTQLQQNRTEQKEQNKEFQHRIERQLKAMESKRTDKLGQSLQQTVISTLSSKLEKTLKHEMKNTAIPVLQRGIQTFGEQWRLSMDQQMQEAVHQVLHAQGLSESIVSGVTHGLQQVMHEQFTSIFAATTLPSFERACQHMYQQVDDAFRRGTAEYISQLQQQRDPVLQQISSSVHSLPTSLASSITTSMQTILTHQLGVLTHHLQQTMSDMFSKIAQEHARRDSDEELALRKKQLVEFVKKHQFEEAFNIALSTENLQLVLFLCQELPPEDLFEINPCPLSQPVLLSMIQQLSVDLIDRLELKIKYLESSILSLDMDNEVTRTHMHHVLEVLSQQLNELEETMQKKAISGPKPKMLKAVRRVRLMAGHLSQPK